MSTVEFTGPAWWGGRPVARKIAAARPRSRVVVTGTISATGSKTVDGTVSYTCALTDGTGEIGLLFVGRRSVAGIVLGALCTVEGTARVDGGLLTLWNPLYRIRALDADWPHGRSINDPPEEKSSS